MPTMKPGTREIQKFLPRRAKSIIKMQSRPDQNFVQGEQEFILRCNQLANRARRSFHNDGPGGSYEGF